MPVGPAAPFVSRGHGRDRLAAILTASDRAAFGSPEPRPAGFVVCAAHEAQAEKGLKLMLCMRKESAQAGDWSYGVGDDHEAAFRRVGKLADCSACHAVGPREGLFDPDTSAPAPSR